ncbi:hypothetical protein F511_18531 [Dorcoceras hygrometricum]|uniref:Uncharacterized protein n=1 Tax=Dorcoceras hygrometricum TaxID=472368 RepID=A0A2Z7AKP8_9LAMI|nr:hypothetical protein F511_18531 [Dorcoceras hygrometricum]
MFYPAYDNQNSPQFSRHLSLEPNATGIAAQLTKTAFTQDDITQQHSTLTARRGMPKARLVTGVKSYQGSHAGSVGTRRSDQTKRFDKIIQQQVTIAKSMRVNSTVACDWLNFENQSKRKCGLQLEADARIQGSTRKRHVLVIVTHVGISSKSSLRTCWFCICWFIDVSTGFDDVVEGTMRHRFDIVLDDLTASVVGIGERPAAGFF